MRPANLIPPEERRNTGKGLRSAPLAYILVGALLLAIGGLTLLKTTENKITDRKAEIAETRHQTKAAEAKATRLSTFTAFHSTAQARTLTITNLANSRFDWEKVLRQLSLISPPSIWLNGLSGSVTNSATGGGSSIALRSEVPGPALSINGCAISGGAIADYITQLKEIEGVTRVGLQTATRGTSAGSECDGHGTVSFEAVAAFDAAPIPTEIVGGEAELAVEAAPEEETEASTEGE